LIEAAIGVIGTTGYDGASTRALAKVAGTSLSAIPYHFGGKRELYLAAAEMIADYAAGRFREAVAVLDDEGIPDRTTRLEQAFGNFLRIVLENAEPHSWTSFVARCAHDNDEAFAVIHGRAVAPMVERLVQGAAEITGRPSGDETLRLRISAMVMAIVGFRLLHGLMLRDMGWAQIGADRFGQIEDMVRDLCRSDFLGARHDLR